jgi:arsenate reductase
MRILILCTGNAARSQMAEAFMKSFTQGSTRLMETVSAGITPVRQVHPMAIRVMKELGIDIAGYHPKSVQKFSAQSFDYVITVCGNAQATCPEFTGKVGQKLHIGFDDPTALKGTDEEMMQEFRRVRDEIRAVFLALFIELLKEIP